MIRKHHSQPKPLMGKPLICNSKPLFRLNPPLTILSDLVSGNPPPLNVSARKGPFKLRSEHWRAPLLRIGVRWWRTNRDFMHPSSWRCRALGSQRSSPQGQAGFALCQVKVATSSTHAHFHWPTTSRHEPTIILLRVKHAASCISIVTSKCCFTDV